MSSKSGAEYDVFISYAHEDSGFVRTLKGWLESAGFNVWLDKERMRAGRAVDAVLSAALQQSRQAVFVLSESWDPNRWGGWELGVFQEAHGKEGKAIPIFRTPLPMRKTPSSFSGALRIDWFEQGQVSDDACFWLLYCALRDWEPEAEDDWERMGRLVRSTARQTGGSVLLSRTAVESARRDMSLTRFGPARAALRCDRGPQWKEIDDHAGLEWHEALFVRGADQEAPELFLEALRHYFPETPARRVVPVAWNADRLPQTKAQFFDELTTALGCRRGSLVEALRDELRRQHLVFVHRPQLPAVLRSDTLVRYYTRHIPELISQLGKTTNSMKLVQGIVGSEAEQAEAERRLREIPARDELPIVLLSALEQITPKDVAKWSETLPPGTDRSAAMARVLAGASTSAEILKRIIAEYGNLKGKP